MTPEQINAMNEPKKNSTTLFLERVMNAGYEISDFNAFQNQERELRRGDNTPNEFLNQLIALDETNVYEENISKATTLFTGELSNLFNDLEHTLILDKSSSVPLGGEQFFERDNEIGRQIKDLRNFLGIDDTLSRRTRLEDKITSLEEEKNSVLSDNTLDNHEKTKKYFDLSNQIDSYQDQINRLPQNSNSNPFNYSDPQMINLTNRLNEIFSLANNESGLKPETKDAIRTLRIKENDLLNGYRSTVGKNLRAKSAADEDIALLTERLGIAKVNGYKKSNNIEVTPVEEIIQNPVKEEPINVEPANNIFDEPQIIEEPVIEDEPQIIEEPVIEDNPIVIEEPVKEEPIKEEPIAEEIKIGNEEPIIEEKPEVTPEPIKEEPVVIEEPVKENPIDSDIINIEPEFLHKKAPIVLPTFEEEVTNVEDGEKCLEYDKKKNNLLLKSKALLGLIPLKKIADKIKDGITAVVRKVTDKVKDTYYGFNPLKKKVRDISKRAMERAVTPEEKLTDNKPALDDFHLAKKSVYDAGYLDKSLPTLEANAEVIAYLMGETRGTQGFELTKGFAERMLEFGELKTTGKTCDEIIRDMGKLAEREAEVKKFHEENKEAGYNYAIDDAKEITKDIDPNSYGKMLVAKGIIDPIGKTDEEINKEAYNNLLYEQYENAKLGEEKVYGGIK